MGKKSGLDNIEIWLKRMGIELSEDAPLLVKQALEQGLLINVTSGKVIRLLPPLIVEKEQMDKCVSVLGKLLK